MDSRKAPHDTELDAWVGRIVARGSAARIPTLLDGAREGVLYAVEAREGVSVVALPTSALDERELLALLEYRMAQYLLCGFVDTRAAYEGGIEHEPLEEVSDADIHFVSLSAGDAEILCYATLRAIAAEPDVPMRSRARPLFPVEKVFGAGVFDRVLGDVPAAKVRELGRFVKNQQRHPFDDLSLRGPVEVGVAVARTIYGPLRERVEALVGDLEEGVADRNMDFFHFPIIRLRGAVGYAPASYYMASRFDRRRAYPFAGLCADILRYTVQRADAIEEALRLPGQRGVSALLALKRTAEARKSSLERYRPVPALTTMDLPQETLNAEDRRRMRAAGESLRQARPFDNLAPAEATALRALMERREAQPGEVIIREGEVGDGLFVIERGEAEVWTRAPVEVLLATLKEGDCVGEIAVVMGMQRTADVVARTPMTLLHLSTDRYAEYLASVAEVDSALTVVAADRLVGRNAAVRNEE